MTVTDGQVFLTSYEDLTISAQFVDEKVPAKHNIDLNIKMDSGIYLFKIRQMFDPTNYEYEAGGVGFEIVVQLNTEATRQQVDKVFWWK
jgi:hypothetical protein